MTFPLHIFLELLLDAGVTWAGRNSKSPEIEYYRGANGRIILVDVSEEFVTLDVAEGWCRQVDAMHVIENTRDLFN